MSKNAYEDPCTATNPRESNPKLVEMIFKSSFYGEDIKE